MSREVYCDRNICTSNFYNNIECEDCIVNRRRNGKDRDMLKIFISQVMADKTDDEIKKDREEIIEYINTTLAKKFTDDIEIMDTYVTDDPPSGANISLWYLGKSIEMLAEADVIVFGRNYWKGRGCLIEQACAEKYGIWCEFLDASDTN